MTLIDILKFVASAGVFSAVALCFFLFFAFAFGYFVLVPARKHSSDFELEGPPLGPGHSNECEQFDADAIGLVVSPLKPFGAIELGGQKVPACSVDGGFIRAGERVQVDRREGRTLFVKRVNVQM